MVTTVCSLDAESVVGEPLPFARLIVFGYSDGPTTGVAECEGGSTAYRFDLLASDLDGTVDYEAWDRGEELRVYGLTALGGDAFARIVAALSHEEQPRWPVWVLGGGGGTAGQDRWDAEMAPLVRPDAPPELVVASNGLLLPVVAARAWPGGGTEGGDDWLAYLVGSERP